MTGSPQLSHDAQVIIVGGGPVGLGLAIDLGQRGVSCIVVERRDTPQPIPKGQNLTQRTLEHFHFWGVEDAVRASRTIPREFGISGLTAYGTLLGAYSYDWLPRELVRPFYFTDNERLPQYATEAALRQRVRELPSVQTLYGWQADDIRAGADLVEVSVADRKTGNTRLLRAHYAVGCDGGRSVTRECAGISQTRSDHDRLMVLLVFRSHGLHTLLERHPGKSFFCVLDPALDGYWKFFGRVDLDGGWFFHAPVPAGTTRDNYDFQRLVFDAAGAEFDVELQHVGFWDMRFASADTYRSGRVFVAGDAAHSHPPYGGYGINTGFEDARNLGWKLAAVLLGWGGTELLDTYDAERRPVFASTARDFIEKSIEDDRAFLRTFNPERDRTAFERAWDDRSSSTAAEVKSFEPNYEGSPIVHGPAGAACSAVGSHAFAARPGHHLTPQQLSSGLNVFEELGSGFTLLCFGSDPETCRAFERAAAVRGIPLKIVRDSRAGGRERYDASFVLIRPDHFVAWAGSETGVEPDAILRKSVGFSE
jgi:2-polyprenyl-6-methoxyphenol hydroxylase-like FAD-dependent oxidoreductase